MNITINNANIQFVNVANVNIFANTTWVNGYYNKIVGQTISLTENSSYFTVETPVDVPNGVSTLHLTYDRDSETTNKIRTIWLDASNTILNADEQDGGDITVSIPSGASKLIVQGLLSILADRSDGLSSIAGSLT